MQVMPVCKFLVDACNGYPWLPFVCSLAFTVCQTTQVVPTLVATGRNLNVYDIRKECEGPLCYGEATSLLLLLLVSVQVDSSGSLVCLSQSMRGWTQQAVCCRLQQDRPLPGTARRARKAGRALRSHVRTLCVCCVLSCTPFPVRQPHMAGRLTDAEKLLVQVPGVQF